MNENLFYPLYKDFDKKFFRKLKEATKNKYEFIGDDREKEKFLKDLIVLQLIKNYRKHLQVIDEYLLRQTDLLEINKQTRNLDFEFDTTWVTFKVEQELVDLARGLKTTELTLIGNDENYDEFVLRYLLSIWLVDWQGPLYAILKYIENKKTIEIKELNKILKLWDFTEIFKDY